MTNTANEARGAGGASEGFMAGDIAVVRLTHPSLTQQIGQPAVLQPGDALPKLHVEARSDLTLTLTLMRPDEGGITVGELAEAVLASGDERVLEFAGSSFDCGQYELRIRLDASGRTPIYDSYTFTVLDSSALGPEQSRIAYLGGDGRMKYVPDYKGNRIMDFSNCGYMGGGVRLPEVPVRIMLESGDGDQTARIQESIDQLSSLPLSPDGFRGALLLKKGTYAIAGTLYIRASGVVLRGEGQEEDGTILHATGDVRRDVLQVHGDGGMKLQEETGTEITDAYVPSGARSFHVADAAGYRAGDTVAVIRHGNAEWIHAIHMDTIVPRPNAGGTKQWEPFDLAFDRVITAVEGNRITVDAPVANAIEHRWGGGTLVKYDDADRIEKVGIENLRVDSDYNPEVTNSQLDGKKDGAATYCADENHAVNFVVLNHVKNAWVRDVTGYHLEHALVIIDRHAKWVTVQDCSVREMVSIVTGGRRYPFHMTGQLSLVQRCDTETARHAFVVDARVCGPNVFFDSESRADYSTSEPHHRWSVGGLYDNVRSPIHIRDRAWMGSGHGWAGANYVTWNTEGRLTVQRPPTAQNYAIGHVGTEDPPFMPNQHDLRPREDGYWDRRGQHVQPRSLYLQQLTERLGTEAGQNIRRT